jgi:4-amino-4-deoxy-L-arabinose transferase-like glycosyltransferase
MPQPVYILFGAAFTVLTAVAMGRLLFAGLKLRFRRVEETLLAFVAGSVCLSAVVFALASIHLVYKGVFLAVGLAAIGGAAWLRLWRERGEPLPALPRFWRFLFWMLFALFAAVYFVNAMMPERSPDGTAYHLGLVARFAREHGFHRITTNMYASLSQGVEMLYLFAFVFGRHSAAAMVHFAFTAALPLMMLAAARRLGFAAAGAVGAMLVFLSPVVGMDGVTAYIDVAVAAILFAVYYLLQIWDEERTPALLPVIGLAAGFGYAAKYTAALAIPFAAGFVAWRLIVARQKIWKPLAIVILCALAVMTPWLAKNWLWVDNPFSPFFNKWFPNPYVHVSLEEEWTTFLRTYNQITSFRQIPVEVTMRGNALCGLLGPVFLLAPLALFALSERAGRRLLAAALVFGATYPMNIGTRFLIPPLPFVALALGMVLVRNRALAPAVLMFHAVASWPPEIRHYAHPSAWRLEKPFPWKQAFRKESEDAYLARSMPEYVAARMIEQFVPAGEPVFAIRQTAQSYTSREILIAYQAGFNHTTCDILWTPVVDDFHPRRHVVFRFPGRALRGLRVVQTASSRYEHWTIAEFHVLSGAAEVPRSPQWRTHVKPTPWDASLALDGNLATRWRSWQSLFPGMYFGVEFERPETVDAVRLQCAFGQYDMRMRVEGLTETGRWEPLEAGQQQTEEPSPPNLRPAAVAAIRARGIRWILVHESDFGSEDLLKNTAAWGITPIADRAGSYLFRLD